jgi:hypothetical protein
MALNCKCKGDRISLIRQELEGVLPDTKVSEHLTQAEAREKQRDVVEAARAAELARAEANWKRIQENHAAPTGQQPASGAQPPAPGRNAHPAGRPDNARRRPGFGPVRRADDLAERPRTTRRDRRPAGAGQGGWSIASLFLGKAFLMGVLGGAAGCAVGYLLTPVLGSRTCRSRPELFQAHPLLLISTLIGAPLVTMMASYLPALSAIAQDPAIVLMDN